MNLKHFEALKTCVVCWNEAVAIEGLIADLEGADLRGADLHGAYLEGGLADELRGNSADLAKGFLKAIDQGTHILDMDTWLDTNCKTTLCLCGWAPEQQKETMETHGVQFTGAVVWPEARPYFYQSNEEALAFLRAEAS